MAKNSLEKSPVSRSTKSNSAAITPSWTHFEPAENDPHDSWDKDAFEKTLQNDPHDSWDENAFNETLKRGKKSKTESDTTDLKISVALNKLVEKVKEGDVSSIKSKKVVYGAARSALVKAQEQAILSVKDKESKAPDSDKSESVVEDLGYEPIGPFSKEAEARRAAQKERITIDAKTGEHITGPDTLAFEKARAEWKRVRDYYRGGEKSAEAIPPIEKEFNDKYAAHLENESKGWRKIANFPRRMFGIQPKLTPELKRLEAASYVAREQYFKSAQALADQDKRPKKGNLTDEQRQKAYKRYEGMLARKLILSVKEGREDVQKKVAIESGKNSYIKPVLENLRKHRYKYMAARVIGYGVIGGAAATGGALAAVGAAGIGGAIYFGRAMAGSLAGAAWAERTHAVSAVRRNELQEQLANTKVEIQQDLFNKGFEASEADIENITDHIAKHAAAEKITAVSGAVLAGIAAGSVAGNLIDTLTPDVPNTPSSVPSDGGGTTSPVEKPAVPDSKSPVNPPDTADTPPKIPNESSPKVEDAPRVVPEENAPTTPEAKPSTPEQTQPHEEVIPESSEVFHKVAQHENWWNIMEGRGADSNPVGGKSLYLKELNLPLGERQALLDKAVDYLEKHPELAKEIGAVKSGGNINQIYPGEDIINITKSDDLLRNIYEGKDPGAVTEAPLSEEFYEDLGTDEEPHEPEEYGPVTIQGNDGIYVIERVVDDVNNMSIGDAMSLLKGLENKDPVAFSVLEEMGLDQQGFQEVFNTVMNTAEGGFDENLTIGEYMNSGDIKSGFEKPTPKPPAEAQPPQSQYGRTPEGKPYGDYNPFNGEQMGENVRFSPAAAAETTGQSLNSFVRNIEQPQNGIFDTLFGMGKPNIAGTFDHMKDLSMGQLREMVANDELPAAVSDDAFDRWMEVVKNVPADDGETFAAVVDRVANSRSA